MKEVHLLVLHGFDVEVGGYAKFLDDVVRETPPTPEQKDEFISRKPSSFQAGVELEIVKLKVVE